MSYQSETLAIRQYLDPLTPSQMMADYTHTAFACTQSNCRNVVICTSRYYSNPI